MMARLSAMCVLLLAFVQQTLETTQIINAGGEYHLDCSISVYHDPDHYIIQFFIEKHEVKMFKGRGWTDTFSLVSNGTTIVPAIANHTDRYSVKETNGRYLLIIKNVTESDSAFYACRSFDLERNETRISVTSKELLVPGPLDGVFWTANYSRLSLDVARQHEIPDGGMTLADTGRHGLDVPACVVLVSNLEPVVNITIGRFGEPGSVDITDQFRPIGYIASHPFDVGTRYRSRYFFVKEFYKSLRDVFCRASLHGKTYERSVSIQVISKPGNEYCDPYDFAALVGSKNVKLTCLIEAHPEPYVEWILPGGRKINALSNNPNYTVTNVAQFEGLLTTLTISEVTEGTNDFGDIKIQATNSEGSGVHYLTFREGAAELVRSSATLISMTTGLLVWMLK